MSIKLTQRETAVLKELAARELSRQQSPRSGNLLVTSLRLDSGLRDALKGCADEQGISLGEALNRAIEGYLMTGGQQHES